MALAGEMRAAAGCLTGARRLVAGVPRHVLAAGLAFYPAIGLGLGALGAAAAALLDSLWPEVAGVAGVAVVTGLAGPWPLRSLARAAQALVEPGRVLGAGVVLACLAARAWAVTVLPAPARLAALLLAPMLGRWAIVVQCYGGAPGASRGIAAALVGRARFREFGAASVCAFTVTLALADAAGLLVLVAAALVTVGLRVVAHRRVGGLTGTLLGATAALVETVVLLVLAGLAAGRVPGALLG